MVDVRVTTDTPLCIVLCAALTHMANAVSWNKIYGIHAYPSFIKHETFMTKHVAYDASTVSMQEWKELGLKISPCSLLDHSESACSKSKMRLTTPRHVSDSRSWIIPLNTDHIESSPFPDYLIDFGTFALKVNRKTYSNYQVTASTLKSPALKYKYIRRDVSQEEKRFRDRTFIGIYCLPQEHRPARMNEVYGQSMRSIANGPDMSKIAGWPPPNNAGWVYHDDEMLEILKAQFPDLAEQQQEVQSRGTKRKRDDEAEDEGKKLPC
jgi:hypothetical protein